MQDPAHPATREHAEGAQRLRRDLPVPALRPGEGPPPARHRQAPETREAGEFPVAWTREQGKGRVFYTALGHREDVLEADWYKAHLLGGIRWALGPDVAH